MTTRQSSESLTRRAAIAGLGAAGISLATMSSHAGAQEATSTAAMATHPIVGTWNVMTPAGPSLVVFLPDGTNIQGLPTTMRGPNGVTFVSTQVGIWEPAGERKVHFTGVQWHSDADGTFIGSVTIDGFPEVSEDGQSLYDDQSQSFITMRDAAGTVVQQVAAVGAPPVTGRRMGIAAPGFPQGTPEATPAT